MARQMTGTDAAAKWARNITNSVPDIRAGVESVTESPTEKAASKSRDWQTAMTAERTRTRFEAGLRRVDLATWKKRTIDKGVARIGSGAEAAKPKMADFLDDFLPHVYAGAQTVRNMPSLTLEDGIARVTAMIRHNAGFTRS